MEWFKSKGGQVIALVSIVSTLAGFGYAGAGYVNRLENLERKIGGIGETEDAQQAIEERFAGIETSVEYLEKQVDSIKIPDVTDIKTDVATVKADIESLEKSVTKLEEGSKNPLAN